MARNDLPPDAQRALAYWPQIELAAHYGMTTADLWSLIRDAADELGLASPGVTVRGVSALRGMAGQIQERGRQFSQLPDSRRVTGRYVSTPIWARPAAAQRALPMFQVRFQHTFTQNGEQQTQWRTSMFQGRLNHTAGQLRSLIALDAANMAREYNTEHLGVSDLQVMAI